MKILHISKYYPPNPGGIESFVRDLAEAQVRSGHQVLVLGHASDQDVSEPQQAVNGVLIIRVRTHGQLAYAPISPFFPKHLLAALRNFRPDAIHVHMPNTSAFWLLFLTNLPRLVVHWHADVVTSALNPKLKWLYKLYQPFEKWLLFRAKTVICSSRPYLDSSLPLRPFRAKCVVIPLGLNPARFVLPTGMNQTPPAKKDGLFVLSVGRFSYYKGFENLIQAAAGLPDVRFCIAGHGELYTRMRRLVQGLGLSERFDLPGSISHERLLDLLWTCDLFCLPSLERTEAFGMVLLEAMCCGKPLITSDIPGSGVSVLNEPGLTGLQVPTNDSEALVEAIQIFAQDREMRKNMGQRAYKQFQEHYHIQRIASLIEKVYTDPT